MVRGGRVVVVVVVVVGGGTVVVGASVVVGAGRVVAVVRGVVSSVVIPRTSTGGSSSVPNSLTRPKTAITATSPATARVGQNSRGRWRAGSGTASGSSVSPSDHRGLAGSASASLRYTAGAASKLSVFRSGSS